MFDNTPQVNCSDKELLKPKSTPQLCNSSSSESPSNINKEVDCFTVETLAEGSSGAYYQGLTPKEVAENALAVLDLSTLQEGSLETEASKGEYLPAGTTEAEPIPSKTGAAETTEAEASLVNNSQPKAPAGEAPADVSQYPAFIPLHLLMFEKMFLTPAQLSFFESQFNDRNFTNPNPWYQSWLPLKRASIPTEEEALQSVLQVLIISFNTLNLSFKTFLENFPQTFFYYLQSHSPKNIQKRKKRGGRCAPEGAARFDPTSNEWKEILEKIPTKKTPVPAKKINTDKSKTKEKKSSVKKKK